MLKAITYYSYSYAPVNIYFVSKVYFVIIELLENKMMKFYWSLIRYFFNTTAATTPTTLTTIEEKEQKKSEMNVGKCTHPHIYRPIWRTQFLQFTIMATREHVLLLPKLFYTILSYSHFTFHFVEPNHFPYFVFSVQFILKRNVGTI